MSSQGDLVSPILLDVSTPSISAFLSFDLDMFSAYTGLVTLLALVALQSHALTLPPADGNLATTAAPLIPILLPVAQDPAESLDDIQIQCKGSSFGTRINYASCLDAFGTFKRGTDNRPITVGQRGSGAFMSLPRRLISGMIGLLNFVRYIGGLCLKTN